MEKRINDIRLNDCVCLNLRFAILMNGRRFDTSVCKTYLDAKTRLSTLKRIFKHSTHEIVVKEKQ